MREVHFLHIGKCAGTQIKALAAKINAMEAGVRIVPHPHRITLAALPPDAAYFFSIRSPETRFVSGFYSRQRKGRPRFNIEWKPSEQEAFLNFEHANDLAEALFVEGIKGWQAFAAMQAIEHLATKQSDYFRYCGTFLLNRPPLTVIRQEHFDRDIGILVQKLGLMKLPPLETDPVTAHRNDYTSAKPLSETAKANLRMWYTQDFELYRQCNSWLEERA